MKILFTGASSFTGYWFAKELAEAGHDITAIFRSPFSEYTGVRKERIELLLPKCRPVLFLLLRHFKFLDLVEISSHWDILCHHAADVTDYKNPDFDYLKAVHNNTQRIKNVFEK